MAISSGSSPTVSATWAAALSGDRVLEPLFRLAAQLRSARKRLPGRAGRFVYSNGGHNPPLWIGAGGRVFELSEGGPLLGFMENVTYGQTSLTLGPGDLIVLYTDGVTEAVNSGGEQFGAERLTAWAARQAGRSPEEVQKCLIEAVDDFSGARPQADDLAVLVVRFTGRNLS